MTATAHTFEVSVPVDELRKALTVTKPLLLPYQQRVRLQAVVCAEGGGVNVEVWQHDAAVCYPIEASGGPFDVTVEHKRLEAALKQTSAAEVVLALTGEPRQSEQLTLQVGLGARKVMIPAGGLDGWPVIDFAPEGEQTLLRSSFWQQSSLAQLFRRVASHASNQEARPVLQALVLDEWQVVATDSFRLIALDLPAYDLEAELPLKETVAVNARLLAKACVGNVEITHKDDHVFVRGDGGLWRILKAQGQWPNWRQLVPPKDDLMVCGWVDRLALLESVAAFSAMCGNKRPTAYSASSNKPLRVTATPEGLELEAHNLEERAVEQISWSAGKAPELGDVETFGVDPLYLADALKVLAGDEVRLEAISPIRPITVTGTDGWVLLMPIRLDVSS